MSSSLPRVSLSHLLSTSPVLFGLEKEMARRFASRCVLGDNRQETQRTKT